VLFISLDKSWTVRKLSIEKRTIRKIELLIFLSVLIPGYLFAEDPRRLRLFTLVDTNFSPPVVEQTLNGAVLEQEIIDGPNSSGEAIHYIGESGVGIGVNQYAIDWVRETKLEGTDVLILTENTAFTVQSLDVSYTLGLGESFTISAGVGIVLGGSLDLKLEYSELVQMTLSAPPEEELEPAEGSSGGAFIAMLGYNFGSIEVSLLYRNNRLTSVFDLEGTFSGTLSSDSKIKEEYIINQTYLGVGLVF